jgi:hypothetical protein
MYVDRGPCFTLLSPPSTASSRRWSSQVPLLCPRQLAVQNWPWQPSLHSVIAPSHDLIPLGVPACPAISTLTNTLQPPPAARPAPAASAAGGAATATPASAMDRLLLQQASSDCVPSRRAWQIVGLLKWDQTLLQTAARGCNDTPVLMAHRRVLAPRKTAFTPNAMPWPRRRHRDEGVLRRRVLQRHLRRRHNDGKVHVL